jgi:hypothetical protein
MDESAVGHDWAVRVLICRDVGFPRNWLALAVMANSGDSAIR